MVSCPFLSFLAYVVHLYGGLFSVWGHGSEPKSHSSIQFTPALYSPLGVVCNEGNEDLFENKGNVIFSGRIVVLTFE